jgi:hypothetical protein
MDGLSRDVSKVHKHYKDIVECGRTDSIWKTKLNLTIAHFAEQLKLSWKSKEKMENIPFLLAALMWGHNTNTQSTVRHNCFEFL